MDFTEGLPVSVGYSVILVVVDRLIRWIRQPSPGVSVGWNTYQRKEEACDARHDAVPSSRGGAGAGVTSGSASPRLEFQSEPSSLSFHTNHR